MKDKVLQELQVSVAILRSREEVVRRFRALCPDCDWTIFMPFCQDSGERKRRMQLLYGFLAWKSATAFVMSLELGKPDILVSAGVSHAAELVACRRIDRAPLGFGDVFWLPNEAVGKEVVALLPASRVTLDAGTQASLARAFGSGGEFAAQPC